MAENIKPTMKEASDSVDKEAIVDSDEDVFGETLGSISDEPKIEEKSSEVKAEEEEPKKEEIKSSEEVKKEPEESKVEETPAEKVAIEKPALDEQIRTAVKEALPEEASKKEDKLAQQLKNTRDYATQVNQHNLALTQNVTSVEAQLATVIQQLKDAGIEINAVKPQYTPPVQPQINPKLNDSLTSAENKFGDTVVDEYLNPQTGKFHKMVAEGNSVAIFQEVNASLDPLVEAINKTKKWEQTQAEKVTQKKADKDALISSIVTKVKEQIGIGGQPLNGGNSKLPTSLSSVRADSNVAKKAIVSEVEEEIFSEHLG